MNPLLLISTLVATARTVTGLKPIDVYWNISNPIFSGGYGEDYENVIEVNRDTHPWEYDQVCLRKLQLLSCELTIMISG